MRNLALFFLATLLAAESVLAGAGKPLYTFYTGSSRGTYYQIAEDISRACPKFDVQVVATQGSLDNVNQLILKSPMRVGYRFAFAQDDALSSIVGTRLRRPVKMVMSMYNEDITIIVNRAAFVHSVLDLSGKRVAVGTPGSGMWFTSAAIRNAAGIDWVAVEKSPEESILDVIVGDVDAMFIVSGHPMKLLTALSASVKNNIEILSLKNELSYVHSKLPARTYLWQEQDVDLRAVRSSLIAATDVPQLAIFELTSCISTALPELRRWGHSKWKDVQSPKLKK